MKGHLAHFAEHSDERTQDPTVEGRVGVAAHVQHLAAEHFSRVHGMQRLDLGVFGFGQVDDVVALNGLMKKRQPQRENQRKNGEGARYHWAGTPGWRVHTSVPDRSPRISASCSGRPVRAGKVPKCRGTTRRTFSMRQASAASFGPMV